MKAVGVIGKGLAPVIVQFTKDSWIMFDRGRRGSEGLSVSVLAYHRSSSDVQLGRHVVREFLKTDASDGQGWSVARLARRFKKWYASKYGREYD